jgi:hypothetical protein
VGRPAKTLHEHALERSFIPSRHANLLDVDQSIARMTFTNDELKTMTGEYWRRLFDLQLHYQLEANSNAEKQEVARAFRDAAACDYGRYRELFFRDGGRLVWAGKPPRLQRCQCADCKRGDQDPILAISPLLY